MPRSKLLIKRSPMWHIYDSTKLQTYQDCHRMFFWAYRMGWTRENESIDLVHGDAIHQGMECLFNAHAKHGNYDAGYDDAMAAYIRRYSQRFDEADWMFLNPKNPEGAQACFSTYGTFYKDDDFELVGNEIYGELPVSPTRTIIGRLDTLIKTKGKIWVVDHKTSKYALSPTIAEGFDVSFQFRTYNLLGLTYTLALKLPKEAFGGVLVNYLTFSSNQKHGTTCSFERIEVKKSEKQMERHLVEINCIIDEIEEQDRRLDKIRKQTLKEQLPLFMPNYGRCHKFFKRSCDFFELCQYHNNPLYFSSAPEVQASFKKEFWDPRGDPKKRKRKGLVRK